MISTYCAEYIGDFKRDYEFKKINEKKYKEISSGILAKNEYKETLFTKEYLRLFLRR